MSYSAANGLQQFKNQVGIKFQLYNSLFTSLPFHRIERSGILLSLLLTNCEDGYKNKLSPRQILQDFFERHTSYTSEQEQVNMLFRFVQYVERQIVLFDALEDAAFSSVNDMQGTGTIKQLLSEAEHTGKQEALLNKLHHYAVRLVLTAHPTQFYPGPVLGIINDLSKALTNNNAGQINMYLQQLGKTPFFKKQKPTPYDEAVSLIWYLENVFYQAVGKIYTDLKSQLQPGVEFDKPFIQMGFWPGGDRDGNPFVTAATTIKVAEALRGSIIKCYYLDVRKLRRRLTFEGVDVLLQELEKKLYDNIFIPGNSTNLSKEEILQTLGQIREIIIHQHNGLFQPLVEELMNRVQIFGLHFASLDIRQESTVHRKVLAAIAAKNDGTMFSLLPGFTAGDEERVSDELVQDTMEVMYAMKTIQQWNGELGCNRYIISQCNKAEHVLEVLQLLLLAGWQEDNLTVDIVPLFETVDDLQQAAGIMEQLYTHSVYKKLLLKRGNTQTIMLGFSDGTKDGGYLMANYSIYKAKEALTAVSAANGVKVIFFDGRGGPPARGGGKTHQFYASMGKNIANNELQLTVQGQTVSSNFGIIDAARFNIEQLLNAGISNDLFSAQKITLQSAEENVLEQLAGYSYEAYSALKNHPFFMQYLTDVSALRYYSETNIASRPTRRGSAARLQLKDLRAIPYVGSWSQLKQNVTGYYGVGSALQKMEEAGLFAEVKKLYNNSLFFKTLMNNCEMAMKKCFFPLTQHLASHPVYGEIWNLIYTEYETTKKYVLKLGGKTELMEDFPVDKQSIQMRERIVMPLITIQQYALEKCRELSEPGITSPMKEVYEKLIMRCSFGIINAARNSA
jgi:phosphoenolpyruvate carboxylase